MIKGINFKGLFFLILAFYCVFLSQFGLENFDTGYIPSFSWRIINGQSVYKDFIYKGPPVTLYFHALFMNFLPKVGQFYFIRILSYIFFALQVYFSVSGFYLIYNFNDKGINKWGLIIICFILSLLNFPPYPWPTTDGLLFASISFWIISKNQNIANFNLFLASFFIVLSALTKQSFYLLPLFFLVWIYYRYGFRKAVIFCFQLLFFIVTFFVLIFEFSSIKDFLLQTTGETTLYQLYFSGFHNYVFISVYYLLVIIIIVSIFLYLRFDKIDFNYLNKFIELFTILLVLTSIFLFFFINAFIASRVLFDAAFALLIGSIFLRKKSITFLMPIIVLLIISWSSSISLGYPYPILFLTGIILSLLLLFEEGLSQFIHLKKTIFFSIIVCLIGFLYNLKPYREQYIQNLNYSLESISPKLKFIKTNSTNYEKMQDLKKLISKFGKRYIVAPNIPMVHYLFDDNSVLPADWIINTEINKDPKKFIDIAKDDKNYVFLEKSFLKGEELMAKNKEDYSVIASYIHRNFKLVEETKYFIIYNGIKNYEKLPKVN